MLTVQQFNVLHCCMSAQNASQLSADGTSSADNTNNTSIPSTQQLTQRDIVKEADLSLGTVNSTLKELKAAKLVDDNNQITPKGAKELEPYKVDNAIIMAAGLSSRFAPISYEKPKGVLTVLGEVIIERQIRQLKEAGIDNITVVVGYKKEEFFYLEDEFGVKIVVNPDYASRNNNSTIKCVEDILGNTYICSSDDYFTANPFEQYVYRSYYSAVFEEGDTQEYCLETKGKNDEIVGVSFGGANAWVMLGHAYWDRDFSKKYLQVLNDVYDCPETAGKLWEDIYADHLQELPLMVMRKYAHGIIWEFDSLDEMKAFDPNFIDNIDSSIMDNICKVFECSRSDITGIVPIKQGLTNLSFKFEIEAGADDTVANSGANAGMGATAGAGANVTARATTNNSNTEDPQTNNKYVYRHPGDGTDAIISRVSETESQKIAHSLGLDDTFIYEDANYGWKISRFVENATTLDYHNWTQVETAIGMARTLHNCDADTGFNYDVYKNAIEIVELLDTHHRTSFKDFEKLLDLAKTLVQKANQHGVRRCLCHVDFYDPNFLVTSDTEMQLIDWEYSAMSDYAVDLGVFICCCSDYTLDDANKIINLYFEGKASDTDRFHCIAYTALASFYWFVWALYKDACGDPVGEYLYLWYKYTKSYGKVAMEMAERLGF